MWNFRRGTGRPVMLNEVMFVGLQTKIDDAGGSHFAVAVDHNSVILPRSLLPHE